MEVKIYKHIGQAEKEYRKDIYELGGVHAYQTFDVINSTDNIAYNCLQKLGPIKCAVVYDKKAIACIMPYRKISKKAIAVIGTMEAFDYSDVLWNHAIDEETAKSVLIAALHEMYNQGVELIKWYYLSKDSLSYRILRNLEVQSVIVCEEVQKHHGSMIILSEQKSYDEYYRRLGKHVRQNLRTAYNRLSREEHVIESQLIIGDELKLFRERKRLKDIYEVRQNDKYNHKSLKHRLFRRFFHYTVKAIDLPNGILSLIRIDGRIVAFMVGYINKTAIEIPILAIDADYSFYSPGMILVNETVRRVIDNGTVTVLDLCRGDEKYKLDMGGLRYETVDINVHLTK